MPNLPAGCSVEPVKVLGQPIGNMWSIIGLNAGKVATCEYQGNRLVLIRCSADWKWLYKIFGITREAVEEAISKL